MRSMKLLNWPSIMSRPKVNSALCKKTEKPPHTNWLSVLCSQARANMYQCYLEYSPFTNMRLLAHVRYFCKMDAQGWNTWSSGLWRRTALCSAVQRGDVLQHVETTALLILPHHFCPRVCVECASIFALWSKERQWVPCRSQAREALFEVWTAYYVIACYLLWPCVYCLVQSYISQTTILTSRKLKKYCFLKTKARLFS